ncbi:MAG: exosome complex exonuclease Rrp41 [Candidatus Aenigmarchaeota archaeon]|nr:exosome complex exonuclease Rrp41 [Candidatus Aenigmarchaeota archaeon]
MKEEIKLIKNNKRIDGRKFTDLRPLEAKVGVLKRADGSAYFRIGNTIAIAGVMGPRKVHPKHMEKADRAILRTEYRMAPFSTWERSRPGPNRRAHEISMVTRKALEPVIFLEEFPKTAINVYIEILQADASTRCAGINAAALALADAGIPMKDLVSSCSAGIIEGQIVLDIAGQEDCHGELDFPIAYYPKKKHITLLQMDGIATNEQFKKILHLAVSGAEKIYEEQKKALRQKYQAELNQ